MKKTSEYFKSILLNRKYFLDGYEHNISNEILPFLKCIRSLGNGISSISVQEAKDFSDFPPCNAYLKHNDMSHDTIELIVERAIEKGFIQRDSKSFKQELDFIIDNYEKMAYANPEDAVWEYLNRKRNLKK
jgi:hypothetical protein